MAHVRRVSEGHDPARDPAAHLDVMDGAQNGRAPGPRLVDEPRHDGPALRVQRRGGLVEEQDRIAHHEDAGDADALLLAAGEGYRREPPEPLRDAQARQHGPRALSRQLARNTQVAQRFCHHVHRRHPWNYPKELAHIAHGPATDSQHFSRLGPHHVHYTAGVADKNLSALGNVVAIHGAQERALARARRVRQHHALAGADGESHAAEHGKARSPLDVQSERLLESFDRQGRYGPVVCRHPHGCNTDDTRSCVYGCWGSSMT